jgi:hypothetical protein
MRFSDATEIESQAAVLLKHSLDPTMMMHEDGPGTSPFGFSISKAQPSRNKLVEMLLPWMRPSRNIAKLPFRKGRQLGLASAMQWLAFTLMSS